MNLPAEQQFIDRLTEIIEANFSNQNFGASELASEIGMSHSSLHRKLKSLTKQSISQFIRNVRLQRGKELLELREGTVAEVAYRVGFGSTTYFTKCFHDHFGYPPGEVGKRTDPAIIGDQSEDGIPTSAKRRSIRSIFILSIAIIIIAAVIILVLESFSGRAVSRIESIAVLPFDNFTGDEDQSFLVYGMHDALIGELGKLDAIRVISKTSALSYVNSDKTLKQIADELGVDAIIEASVLSVDESVRIQLKLFNVIPEERQLWSQTFDIDLGDVLNLYNQVIKNVASEIQMSLSPELENQLNLTRRVNPESYKAYLRGRYYISQYTEEGMKKGLEYLHEAVRIDPAEPLAYAGLALGYMEIAHGAFASEDVYLKAEAAAIQAVKLDTTLAEAYLALSEVYVYSLWRFEEGERYIKKALELNPSLSAGHYHYAWTLFLLGRHEEAIAEHALAQKYDPFYPSYTVFFGSLYCYLGQYENALREVDKALAFPIPFPLTNFPLGEIYLAMGENEKAIEAHEELAELAPEFSWLLGSTYALTGHREKAEEILKEWENMDVNAWTAVGLSVMYGALGRVDEAFEWIAYEPHHMWIPWVTCMHIWKPLWGTPQFDEFAERLNIPKV